MLPWLRHECAFLESTHTDVQAYPVLPYLPIPPNHGIGDESGMLVPEKPVAGVPGTGIPLAFPLNSTPRKWAVRPLPASGISNGDLSSNTHSFTGVDTVSNLPVARILPGTSHVPPPIESRKRREPQDRPHQYNKSRTKGKVESLHLSKRPADIRKARTPRFSCNDCGAKYVQRQGLNRHRREKHKPNLCMYCGAKWGRPYEFRDHLEKHHPDVDRDMALGKPAGSRRRSAIFVRRPSQQVSLPTIDHGGRDHSGIREYPPASAVAKPSTVTISPPDMTYAPQPESTRSIMTSNSIPEGAVNLDCFMLLTLITLSRL
jgi:hypothetical protein